MKIYFFFFLFFPSFLFGQKLDGLLIDSKVLDRKIEVFILDYSESAGSPVFYFTDGKKMIESVTASIIDSLTNSDLIPKAKYIFVSTIDPGTGEDYRNEFFFCNKQYVDFFEKELIPAIESKQELERDRYLVGISFGGLNAAFFAAETNKFQGFALLSPITYPCESINQKLAFSTYKDYKIYISTGRADAESYVEILYPMIKSKTPFVRLIHTNGGHNFENWNQQLLGVITFLHE